MGDLYAEQAVLDVLAFLADATTGIAARIAAIDTAEADAYVINATTWAAYQHDGMPRTLPAYAVVAAGPGWRLSKLRTYQNLWRFPVTVQFALSYIEGGGVPQTIQRKAMRVAAAWQQCIEEEDAWSGHTLGGRVEHADWVGKPAFGSLLVGGNTKRMRRLATVSFPMNIDRAVLSAKT